jgi:hypothetical protein
LEQLEEQKAAQTLRPYGEELKMAAATIPLVSGVLLTLGFAFDAGYFWALDVNMMTMFTISEHILFALQAMPMAIASIVVCVPFVAALFGSGFPTGKSSANRKLVERTQEALFYLFSAGLWGWIWYRYQPGFSLWMMVAAWVALSLTVRISRRAFPQLSRPLFIAAAGFAPFGVMYVTGYIVSRSYQTSTLVTH